MDFLPQIFYQWNIQKFSERIVECNIKRGTCGRVFWKLLPHLKSELMNFTNVSSYQKRNIFLLECILALRKAFTGYILTWISRADACNSIIKCNLNECIVYFINSFKCNGVWFGVAKIGSPGGNGFYFHE